MKTHELFKGLSDPTRLRIVALLLDRELCVCDILGVLELPQSTVSRHLTKLKTAGLVLDRRDGKWVHYRLSENALVGGLRRLLKEHILKSEPFSEDRKRLSGFVASGRCVRTK